MIFNTREGGRGRSSCGEGIVFNTRAYVRGGAFWGGKGTQTGGVSFSIPVCGEGILAGGCLHQK